MCVNITTHNKLVNSFTHQLVNIKKIKYLPYLFLIIFPLNYSWLNICYWSDFCALVSNLQCNLQKSPIKSIMRICECRMKVA